MLKKLGLGIVLATSFMAMIPAHASTTANLEDNDFSQAKLSSTKGGSLYEGNKLHFQDEQDQLIFSDNFSSVNLAKWNYSGVGIVNDGSVSAATFSQGSTLELADHSLLDPEGFYRVTYDMKVKNYNDESDLGKIEYKWGIWQTSVTNVPIKEGQWQHVEDIYTNSSSNSDNSIKILGPETPQTTNAEMYITNFKIYKIVPTYIEDFSDGTIDSRFSTNSKFDYSVIDNNGTKALKVDIPQNSLSDGIFENVLTAKETLAPIWYDPQQGVIQEGISYLSHQTVGNNNSSNPSIIRNGITDDHGYYLTTDYLPTYFPAFPAFAPVDSGLSIFYTAGDTINPTEVTYGVSASTSSINDNKETLYIRDIQMYKGTVEIRLNTNTVERVISTH